MKNIIILLAAAAAFFLAGCVEPTIPADTFMLTSTQLEQRQIESRRYDGVNEVEIISASANLLQDLGYNLENTEAKLGVHIAQKHREAGSAGQTAGAIALGNV